MDFHKCGDCQKEFDSYERFLIHKLLVEQYKLTLEPSVQIPGLRLPKFVKINHQSKPIVYNKGGLINSSAVSIPTKNGSVEKSKDKSELPFTVSSINSPAIEIVIGPAHSEDVVSDDDISVSSQPESLRIDEDAAGKYAFSPRDKLFSGISVA